MTRRKAASGNTAPKTEHQKALDHWAFGFNYWEARQRGEKPPIYNEMPCQGYYRNPITEKLQNGQRRTIGYEPVAIFMREDHSLLARVGPAEGGRDVVGEGLNDLWTWVAQRDISEAAYDAVARRGELWPDSHVTEKAVAKAVADGIVEAAAVDQGAHEIAPEDRLAAEIEAKRAGLAQYETIESDGASARARSLQAELLELKGSAEKQHKAEKEPHLAAGRAVDKKWFGMRDAAAEAILTLRTSMSAWEDTKRAAAKQAEEDAARKAAEHAKAVREAEAANKPAPPPPEPVKVNTPAPSVTIKGAVGRAATVKVEKFVTAIDDEKVFAQFKGNEELTALLIALAQKAIRAGVPVPGATVEERSTVR